MAIDPITQFNVQITQLENQIVQIVTPQLVRIWMPNGYNGVPEDPLVTKHAFTKEQAAQIDDCVSRGDTDPELKVLLRDDRLDLAHIISAEIHYKYKRDNAFKPSDEETQLYNWQNGLQEARYDKCQLERTFRVKESM